MLSNYLLKLNVERLCLQGKRFNLLGIDLGKKYTGFAITDDDLKKAYVNQNFNQNKTRFLIIIKVKIYLLMMRHFIKK